jgi:DNA-binding NarL/FixJ family response regulator
MKATRRSMPFFGRTAPSEWLEKPAMARILIADDEEQTRRVIDIMLKHAGHDTVLAADGQDALHQFGQQRFDLVICDYAGDLQIAPRSVLTKRSRTAAVGGGVVSGEKAQKRSVISRLF